MGVTRTTVTLLRIAATVALGCALVSIVVSLSLSAGYEGSGAQPPLIFNLLAVFIVASTATALILTVGGIIMTKFCDLAFILLFAFSVATALFLVFEA